MYIYIHTVYIDIYSCIHAHMHLYTHTHSNESLLWFQTRCLILFRLKALTKRVDAKISPDDNLKVEVSDQISLGWNGLLQKRLPDFDPNQISLTSHLLKHWIFWEWFEIMETQIIFLYDFWCIWILSKNGAIKCSNVPFCRPFLYYFSGIRTSPHVAFMTRTSIEPISSPDHASGGLQAGLGRHFGWRV